MKVKLLLLTLFASAFSWGQIISWNFTAGNSPNVNLPGGTTALSFNTGGTIATSGCSGNGYSSNSWSVNEYLQIEAPTTGYNITTMTFNIASSGSGPRNFKFQYSSTGTGGTFTDLGTTFISPNGTSPCSAISGDFTTINALDNNANTVIRLVFTGGEADGTPATGNPAAGGTFRIDDLVINGTATTPTPTLTVSETALTAMDYVVGSGPSNPVKTFTIAGSNLAPTTSNNVIYVSSLGALFEYSTDNITFAEDFTSFTFTGSSFSQIIYVRLKAGLSVNTYSDVVEIGYYNDTNSPFNIENTVNLSGAVTAAAATITTTAITGSPFCVTATTSTSVSVPFTSTGTFTGNTYTAQLSSATGSFASPISIGTLVSNANSGTISATIPANIATGTAYRIRVIASNPSTIGGNNGTNLIINLANNSIAPTANQTIPLGVNGNTLTVTETSIPTSRVWKYGTTIGSYTTTTASTGLTYVPNFATAGTYYVVCESTFSCGTIISNYVTITVNTPVITVTGTPTLFTYAQGQGPSAYQTLNVSGTSLTDNITITVPTANWELSTNIAFSSPTATITLTKNVSTHVVSSTPVYVRLKAGLLEGFYEFPTDTDFVATSTNAVTRTADLDGQVTAPVPFINVEGNIGTFPDITPVINTPSALDNSLFAQQIVGASQTKSFRIQNLGGLPLTISSVTIVGTNPLDFTVTTPPPSTIAAGETVTFDVAFSPTSSGVRSAIVRIANNSNNITPIFDFNVQGTGNNPEIGITGSGIAIPSGSTATSSTNNTYFGNANANPANPTTVSQNFVISNSGNVALNITAITITGVDSSQFSISSSITTIAAGATGNITVTFAPTSIGIKNAIINIVNNDFTDGENPYTFAVQGNAESYVVCAPSGDQILVIQNFDSATPVWGYTVGPLTFYDFGGTSSDGFWGLTTSTGGKSYASNINYTPITNNFLFLQDLQCESGDGCSNTTGTGILTFDAVDISGKQNVRFSFDYDIYQFDTGDGAFYELFYDNVSQGEVQFITGLGDLTTEGTINISIPSTVNSFHFVLKIQQNGTDAAGFDNFKIIYSQLAEKTWDGTAWSGDGLPPTSSQKAIIDGPYITGTNGSFNCCSLVVNSGVGRTLTISSEFPVIVQNNVINNGVIDILNNGQLIQVNETDSNSGTYNSTSFKVQRIAFVHKQDYVYWSSPVENFNVGLIPTQQRYFWNPINANTNGTQGNWNLATGANATMIKGKGYIVNSGNAYPVRPLPAISLEANFVGKPNNGLLTTQIQRGTNAASIDDNWNLVGNPYPSAIFADEFLDANATKINGSVWVWTHGQAPDNLIDPFYDDFEFNYYATDYLKYNKLGSTDTTFNGIIASGQGFLTNMLHTTPSTNETVEFSNAMRTDSSLLPYNNSGFFKAANNSIVSTSIEEKHRIWLTIINPTLGQKDAALVGYSTNSTLAVDHFYDCIFIPKAVIGIYSLINTGEYAIQGRSLPFNDADIVPLGVKIVNAGNHTIGIKKVDGLFIGNQEIYLEDTVMGVVHNIKQAPYTFTSDVGVFNNRFILRYTPSSLSNDDLVSIENSILVTNQNNNLSIVSSRFLVSKVVVYDILGRELLNNSKLNSTQVTLPISSATNQAMIIKVTLENGQTVTKKLVF